MIPTPTALCLLASLCAAPAWSSPALATRNGCSVCHAVDRKVIGPAFRDVAKKYEGVKDAEILLVQSIKAGGSWRWGPTAMPPQTGLGDADAKALAAWILDGAK